MVPTAYAEGVPPLPPPDLPATRSALRRQLRAARRALLPHHHAALSRDLCRNLACLPLFRRARRIAFYLPNDGEADLTSLIRRAWAMGKQCYLPVLSPTLHGRLWFAPYRPDSPLIENRFGIPEPRCRFRDALTAPALDLVLTPLVAFDAAGNRLGMGGGFYDRTLAYLALRAQLRKPRLLGVAFELQRVERLPVASWDVPLAGVVTECGRYRAP